MPVAFGLCHVDPKVNAVGCFLELVLQVAKIGNRQSKIGNPPTLRETVSLPRLPLA